MRSARLLGGIALVLGLVGGASAQTVPYTATVKPASVEVFCSPGNGELVYATNVLPQGAKVQVVEERPDGWLAIKPPPKSFSLINKLYLEPKGNDTYLVTTAEDATAPVVYGHAQYKKPTAIAAKLARGTLVRAVGQPITAEDGVWLPIEPPDREVRYIKAEAVTRDAVASPTPPPAQNGAYQPSVGGQPSAAAVPLVPPPSDGRVTPTPQAGVNPQWAEAERLERAGQIKEAIALYDKLGQAEVNHDYELAMRCYNRAGYLRRYLQTQPQTQASYGAVNDTRLRPVATGSSSQAAPTYAPQCACAPYGQNVASAYYGQNVAVRIGRLRESGRQVNYQKSYVLMTTQDRIIAYVNPARDVNLQQHVGQIVELEGPMYWDGELRANYMTARSVTQVK
jgi:hypothetical protein